MSSTSPAASVSAVRTIDLGALSPEEARERELRALVERIERLESALGTPNSRCGPIAKRLSHLEDDQSFTVSPERVAAGIRALAPFAPDRIVKLDALLAYLLAGLRGPRPSLDRIGLSLRTLAAWGLVSLVIRKDGDKEPGSTFEVAELGVHVVGVRPRQRSLIAEAFGEHIALSL